KSYTTENASDSEESKVLNLKRDWTKLFRGISPDYGPTPPYAALFLKEDPKKVMTGMVELYMDGGYDGFQKIHDRVDYIGTAFQYLSFINLLRINAARNKNALEYSRLSLCFDEFFNHYVKPWVNTFCDRADKILLFIKEF
ncbi:MAG: molecular chaperone TorD family protein, partial [Burkholderiales bacterium]|nr:molecular chaperone TorD family protein [Burkholderiales bacterium]